MDYQSAVQQLPRPLLEPGPVFRSSWWLEAACDGRCETIELRWDRQIVGAISFVRTRRLGLTVLRMPPYTRTLGPFIAPPPSKPFQHAANIRRIVRGLVAALPPHDHFELALEPDCDPALPFAFDTAGLAVSQAFTFRVLREDALSALWTGMDQKTRNMIRSARAACAVAETHDFERFEALSRIEHSVGDTTHDYPLLRRLFSEARARGQASIVFAVREGLDAAAAVLLWDQDVIYYWTTARDRALGGGASALLLWHAMEMAKSRDLVLDMDGYCSAASARFLASFGTVPIVRPVVSASSLRYRVARLLRDSLGGGRPRVAPA